jgi:hypothetical protein
LKFASHVLNDEKRVIFGLAILQSILCSQHLNYHVHFFV